MLIWLHARDSTQSSLHSSFCTHFSPPLISFAIISAAHSVDLYVRLVKSSHSVCRIFLMLQISILLCFLPFFSCDMGWCWGPFQCKVWREKVFMTYLLMEVSLPPSVSDTVIHISGINKSFHSLLGYPVWYHCSLLTNLIQLGKKRFSTWALSWHALFAPYREEMKTNTVGFVLLQKQLQH